MNKDLNIFKNILAVFNSLRYFYDKMPIKGELSNFSLEEETLKKLNESHSGGISLYYIADLRKTQIVDAGGNFYHLTNKQPTDIINRNFAYGLKFFYFNDLYQILNSMIKYHEYIYTKKIEVRNKIKGNVVIKVKNGKGGYFVGLLQAVPLACDSLGHVAYMYTSITDITHLQFDDHNLKACIIDSSDENNIQIINMLENNDDIIDIKLSKSEIKILELLAKGMNAKEIAESLFISEHTVKTHRKNMIQKTNVKNTAELISKAGKLIKLR